MERGDMEMGGNWRDFGGRGFRLLGLGLDQGGALGIPVGSSP